MKFFITFTTLIAAAATAAALEAGPVASLEERSADLNARACVPSSCVCNNVQGQFCGNERINKACTNGHVFECNKSTGKTCSYGPRTSCQKCGKLSC
ncbi:hypothetical protein PM082_012136 [Marasmius tenuissimus]|nr:hypothetical protein PM082_012136 [Marasmius tenuissimus]